MEQANGAVKSVTVSAVIRRADGTVEDLGVIASKCGKGKKKKGRKK